MRTERPWRVAVVREITAAPYAVVGSQVRDIVAAVKERQNAGVAFERYAALVQDDDSIWTAPGRARVAWFKDPDGNVLSISQRWSCLSINRSLLRLTFRPHMGCHREEESPARLGQGVHRTDQSDGIGVMRIGQVTDAELNVGITG